MLPKIRAVLVAHSLTMQNRMIRDAGRFGAIGILLLLAFLMVTLVVPFLGLLGTIGYHLGRGLPRSLLEMILGVMYGGLSLFGGMVSGALGGAKQLTWESYRSYPLRVRTIYFSELAAGLGDFLPLSTCLGLTSLTVGVALGAPGAIPLLPLVLLEAIATVLVVQLLVSSLAEVVVRRLRVALVVLAFAFWMGLFLMQAIPQAAKGTTTMDDTSVFTGQLVVLGKFMQKASKWLPNAFASRSLAYAVKGQWGRALLDHLYPLACLLALNLFAARLLVRESSGRAKKDSAKVALWGFDDPVAGIARLEFQTVIGSQVGRFGLIVPLVTIAVIKGPFGYIVGAGPWLVPAAFAYLSLGTNHLHLNNFGLDGHGVKTLMLLPIEPDVILRGKTRGLAYYQGVQALLMASLLFLLHRPTASELTAGLLLSSCFFLAQNVTGRITSSWMPRAVPRASVRSGSTPMPLVLIGLGLTVVTGALFGGIYTLANTLAPTWLVPVMVLVLGASWVAHRMMRPSAARYLVRQRGKIVEAMG